MRTGVPWLLVALMGCAAVGLSRTATAEPGGDSLFEFLAARRDRAWRDVPRKTLAFYYSWYGTQERHGRWVHWDDVRADDHWIGSSTNYPAKGAYDSYDPEIIDYHMSLARGAGIDGFVATWWGPDRFDDGVFPALLDHAAAHDMEMSLYWETVPGEGQQKRDRAVDDLVYALDRYGSHPAFLKVDGLPVIFVYGRVMNEVELGEWPEIIRRAKEAHGGDFLLIADGYQEGYARVFDGVHTYNIAGWTAGLDPDALRDSSRAAFGDAVRLARSREKISCITVIPGYDDTKIRTPGLAADRQNGSTYRVLWEEAIAADPDWVLVTSWNEWHEGSEIEPSHEDGDAYIGLTGEYTTRFAEAPHAASTPSAVGVTQDVEALRKRYAGTRIAILPGYESSVVFWLADAGLSIAEVRSEDVVDPARFNADTYPVAVYASHETYRRTVNVDGDIDDALRGYLASGGLLVCMSSGPFPFYSADDDVVNSAVRLGLPVKQGWEQPPADADLRFNIDTSALLGLDASFAFPLAGDLRWRPASQNLTDADDLYMPLARLVDGDGEVLGDGIAYVEHRGSEPIGGKTLYVWMRMPDVIGVDRLYPALFSFALERAER
ncbi:hypothetical protein HN371_26295 [Candidatus Poribacteria bacterium]|jgi:hypothetical protein|nr:hypothetical protein [Candidatus Poribacteria bacterium]MBT5532756.1 hypothetical protein [Candidatus Poribacteria bacterium]MBT5711250.1 hypothetical protein [Candidatus Poribacteria bacterium]MBT7804609.1 hypothetical protein [Candidatus Poribacteria bacterium]